MECDVVDGRRPLSGVMWRLCLFSRNFPISSFNQNKNSLWTCGCVRRSIYFGKMARSLCACRQLMVEGAAAGKALNEK